MKSNIEKTGKLVVGGTMREKLKAKLKEIIRRRLKEISTSAAAGSGPGSAGVPKVPAWGGKVKDPTKGLAGYTQVGKSETGTIMEKEKKTKEPKSEKPKAEPKAEPKVEKPEATPYVGKTTDPLDLIKAKITAAQKEIDKLQHATKKLTKKD